MVRILIFILLLAIIYIDIKKLYIPNFLNLLLLMLGIYYKGTDLITIENSIIGMGVYTVPIIILYGYLSDLLKKEVFGFGDIKLLLALGYILGYTNLYNIYIYYMIAFSLGAIMGIILGILKKDFRGESPFSPFLILGFLFLWVR